MSSGFFASRFAGPRMETATPPSKGVLLARLERLIIEAHEELRAFAEGRTLFIAYVRDLRDRVQHCLADIGELAQKELPELAAMDFGISEDLARWYAQGVYNDFQVKQGDPSDFLRAQAEYDRETPPKIERMIALMHQVRNKMLGLVPTGEAARLIRPFPTPDGSTWPNVMIRFTSDFQVQLTVSNRTEVRNYIEMGFEDRRAKRSPKPDQNWETLREFARSNGVITSTKDAADWPKLEKAVEKIKKRLRSVFGLSDPPIMYDRPTKSYRTAFEVLRPPDDETQS